MSVDTVLQDALSLSDSDRLQLVESLIASFEESGSAAFDDAWLAEIKRRTAEIESGSVPLIPWNEVKKTVRQRAVFNH